MGQSVVGRTSGRRVAGAIRSLVNARDLQIECARVLHETLLAPVLMYGSETMLWKEERSRIKAVQMDNLRGLLGIRRMDTVLNARIRELCGVKKWVDERLMKAFSGGSAMRRKWRMIGSPRVYVGDCAGSRSVGRPRKR